MNGAIRCAAGASRDHSEAWGLTIDPFTDVSSAKVAAVDSARGRVTCEVECDAAADVCAAASRGATVELASVACAA